MELWNRTAAAVFLGLAVLLLAAWGLGALLGGYPSFSALRTESTSAPPPAGLQSVPRPAARSPELLRLRQRTAMLESELEQRNRTIESLQDALAEAERQQEELRTAHDESLRWLSFLSHRSPPATDTAETLGISAELDAALPDDSDEPQAEPPQMEIEELRAQVDQLQAVFDAAQIASDRELAALRERQDVLEQAATAAFVRAGAPAVPGLIAALEAEAADVRRWAADTLAALGPDGQAAINALTLTRGDPDERVRAAVERALRSVQN